MTKKDKKEEPPIPMGMLANPETSPQIEWGIFFELKGLQDRLNKLLYYVEQQQLSTGNLRYYYESDLVGDKPKEGEKDVRVARDDFFNKTDKQ